MKKRLFYHNGYIMVLCVWMVMFQVISAGAAEMMIKPAYENRINIENSGNPSSCC